MLRTIPTMYAEPAGFDHAALIDALRAAWGFHVAELEYVPVGFGTHHYRVRADGGDEWFVNVDEPAMKAWLEAGDGNPVTALDAALGVAVALRGAGLEFVHAPIPTRTDGSTLAALGGDYAVSVYPFLRGTSNPFAEYHSEAQRYQVLTALGRMHAATDVDFRLPPRRNTLQVPLRHDFEATLEQLNVVWTGGPYAEPARNLLRAHVGMVRELFDRHDDLATEVLASADPSVITHGETHAANAMQTPDGAIRLIDWDTAAIGPRERDLWMVEPKTDADWAAYTSGGGAAKLNPSAIELYRIWWTLSDITSFTHTFRSPHCEDANTRVAWRGLQSYLTN